MNSLGSALDNLGLEDEKVIVAQDLDWSQKQLDIFEFVKNGKGNAVVEAVAGSGKTTTILKALNYTDEYASIAFVAFNKRIADELRDRAPSHVHVSTLHSLGLKNIKKTFPKTKIDKNKMWKLIDIYKRNQSKKSKELLKASSSTILRLVSLLKFTMSNPTYEELDFIVDHYGINVGESRKDFIYTSVQKLWKMSLDTIKSSVNFDDMIFAPAYGITQTEKFDFLFVDEAQDLNAAQIQFILKSVKPTGRTVAVGDRFQSIYGFTGADTKAIPNLIEALDAITLPLTVTYRCSTNMVELAQEFVPHIEAYKNAPEGIVKDINVATMFQLIEEGDLVICRVNAPLVPLAFTLIREGVKAVILGREIGTGLIRLIDRVGKRNSSPDIVSLLKNMNTYVSKEVAKLTAANKNNRALILGDQFKTIVALSDGCDEISEIKQKIRQVFDDNRKGVTFSSIHKIKGGEAERVFIINREGMPHPMAILEWEIEQENNIIYVALTRAKKELYFVG